MPARFGVLGSQEIRTARRHRAGHVDRVAAGGGAGQHEQLAPPGDEVCDLCPGLDGQRAEQHIVGAGLARNHGRMARQTAGDADQPVATQLRPGGRHLIGLGEVHAVGTAVTGRGDVPAQQQGQPMAAAGGPEHLVDLDGGSNECGHGTAAEHRFQYLRARSPEQEQPRAPSAGSSHGPSSVTSTAGLAARARRRLTPARDRS